MEDTLRRWPQKALSALAVRNAKPGKHYDGNGLYLRVEPNGAKRWVQRLVIQGKSRELGLGSAGLVTLAEAREEALANRRLARRGGDPIAARREASAVMTFEEAARAVHKAHLPTWRNPKHGDQWIATLSSYAFPLVGRKRISEVTSADVLSILSPIWVSKPETARRVRQRIRTVLDWAIAKNWRSDNPADTIDKVLPKHEKRRQRRRSLPYSDVATCIEAVRASGASASTKHCLELAILTAVRSSEARLAHRGEVNLDARVWTVPADRMKTGREHRVPLSPRAVEILELALEIDDGSGLLFPGSKRGKPLSDATMLKLVRECGFPVDVHGFRTSFRTWAQECTSFPREIAEHALAHVVGDASAQAYERSDVLEKRREVMEAWAKYIGQEKEAAK